MRTVWVADVMRQAESHLDRQWRLPRAVVPLLLLLSLAATALSSVTPVAAGGVDTDDCTDGCAYDAVTCENGGCYPADRCQKWTACAFPEYVVWGVRVCDILCGVCGGSG